ncbi:MAG TPA: hypothetical protein PLW32_00475 [Chitinophagaceae bacterium]|nr:hypothetical protein [Chitinophagaceae bacterium]HPH22326.1 hypothetical protein [Chitinophagaceae bacterium]
MKQICLFTIFFLYAVFNSQAQRLLNNRFSNIQLKDSVKVFTKPLSIIPTNFYNSQLGFICKKELLLEKKTKIPFRFRLGSLAYTNMLEGKKY